jgi:hypothetical protein
LRRAPQDSLWFFGPFGRHPQRFGFVFAFPEVDRCRAYDRESPADQSNAALFVHGLPGISMMSCEYARRFLLIAVVPHIQRPFDWRGDLWYKSRCAAGILRICRSPSAISRVLRSAGWDSSGGVLCDVATNPSQRHDELLKCGAQSDKFPRSCSSDYRTEFAIAS